MSGMGGGRVSRGICALWEIGQMDKLEYPKVHLLNVEFHIWTGEYQSRTPGGGGGG